MKENVVDIRGHKYRYAYDAESQKTTYLGPVGNAPALDEDMFKAIVTQKISGVLDMRQVPLIHRQLTLLNSLDASQMVSFLEYNINLLDSEIAREFADERRHELIGMKHAYEHLLQRMNEGRFEPELLRYAVTSDVDQAFDVIEDLAREGRFISKISWEESELLEGRKLIIEAETPRARDQIMSYYKENGYKVYPSSDDNKLEFWFAEADVQVIDESGLIRS
jgi:hypothetical protein